MSGMVEADHLCRNRACVNPTHLEWVDRTTNIRRGESPAAIHRRQTRCIHGHPFDAANTYVLPDGERACRECGRIATRAYIARQKERIA